MVVLRYLVGKVLYGVMQAQQASILLNQKSLHVYRCSAIHTHMYTVTQHG